MDLVGEEGLFANELLSPSESIGVTQTLNLGYPLNTQV